MRFLAGAKALFIIPLAAALVTACGGDEAGPDPQIIAAELSGVVDFDVDASGIALATDVGIFRLDPTGGQPDLVREAEMICDVELIDGALYVAQAARVWRAETSDELSISFSPFPDQGCSDLDGTDDELFIGYGGYDHGELAWAPRGATEIARDAHQRVSLHVLHVAGDADFVYFIAQPQRHKASSSLWRSSRTSGELLRLAEIVNEPSRLALDATTVYWAERGTQKAVFAVDKDGGPVRTLVADGRGCGDFGGLMVADGHVYFGSHQGPEGETCGGTNYFTISRVPVGGGDVEDVLAKHGFGTYRSLRVHGGRIFSLVEDARNPLSTSLVSIPVP